MKIALDFDDTYTLDPPFWNAFIASAKNHNHEVYIVTMRHPHEDICVDVGVPVIYTCRLGKKYYARENYNLEFDVWIDDHPEYVYVEHHEIRLREIDDGSC